MAMSTNIYSPENAAKFLNVTMEELKTLTQQGDAVLRQGKGRKFYLGGELDCLKHNVQQRLGRIPA